MNSPAGTCLSSSQAFQGEPSSRGPQDGGGTRPGSWLLAQDEPFPWLVPRGLGLLQAYCLTLPFPPPGFPHTCWLLWRVLAGLQQHGHLFLEPLFRGCGQSLTSSHFGNKNFVSSWLSLGEATWEGLNKQILALPMTCWVTLDPFPYFKPVCPCHSPPPGPDFVLAF